MATLQTRVQHLSPAKQAVLRAMLEKKDIGTAQFLRLTNSNLVPIKSGRPGAPALFVCPATEGSVAYFKHYAPYLPESWALFGCQTPGLDGEREPYRTVEALAEHNIAQIKAIQPRGPYYLAGNCMGGLPAYEMARRLQQQGDDVALVLHFMPLFSRAWEHLPQADALQMRAIRDYAYIIERLLGVAMHLPYDQIEAMAEGERTSFIVEFIRERGYIASDLELEAFKRRMETYKANLHAMLTYKPRGDFNGVVRLLAVGDKQRGEVEIELASPYAAHLCVLPEHRIDVTYVDTDPGALFDGSQPAMHLIGQRLHTMLKWYARP